MPRPGPRRDLVCVRMSDAQIAALDELAAEDDTDRSDIVRKAVVAYVMGRKGITQWP